MKPKYVLILLVFSFASANSQRANNWYFGAGAGLNFTTNPPTALTNGQTNNPDNTSAISDLSGNLLFYTDGMTVWNTTHAVMPNGTGLIGHSSAGQCAVIVPIPCSSGKYAIFQTTEFASPGQLHYTVVDMSLNSGLGDVVSGQKNVSLGTGWTEKICAYYNASGNNYWVLVHKWNTNQFVAFDVNTTSIAANSVTSSIGSVHNCGTYGGAHDAAGQLTISQDGTKVLNAMCCQDKFELFNFNSSTGILSNSISIAGTGGHAWGTAFSPDNTKIYVNTILGTSVYQYDISNYNQTSVVASQFAVVTLTTGGYNFGYMELGPDSKLYIARPAKTSLSVINNPNGSGANSNFSLSGQSLGSKISTHGLSRIAYNIPSNVPSLSIVSSPTNPAICSGNSVILTVQGNPPYLWNTGSTAPSIIVTPNLTTVYSVTASANTTCVANAAHTITVFPVPSLTITSSKNVICRGQNAVLTAGGAASYTWSTSQVSPTINVAPLVTTTYSLTGESSQGCGGQSFITVSVAICEGIQDLFENSALVLYPNPVQNVLTLETPANSAWTSIRILNTAGQVVYTADKLTFSSTEKELKINLEFLSKGFYFVQGTYGDKQVMYKLIKE